MSRFALLVLLVTVAAGLPAQTPRAEGSLRTRWAQEVDRMLPWPEYPRPTMRRPAWKCLNGPWHYAIRDQTLTVAIWDPSDAGSQPRGKQVREPRGIWYTPSTGIWQTVWMEPVPPAAITRLEVGSDVDRSRIHVRAGVHAAEPGDRIVTRVFEGRCVVAVGEGPAAESVEIPLNAPRLWSPQDPHLYDLRIELHRGAALLDAVRSYCGLRKISLAPGPHGAVIHLNGAPLFQIGPLDQGFWPDGLYTAPTDAWQDPAFDATSWERGPAGFGRKETPGARVGTAWTGDQIWLRRRFVLDEIAPAELWLRIHHDEDAEVFLNGARIAKLAGYTTSYGWHALPASAAQHLRPGENLLAVHCQQTSGGQFIDVGIFVREE